MITMKLKISLIAFTLATTLLVGVTWANNLPDLGDVSQTVLTPLQEQAIAEQILREVAVSDEAILLRTLPAWPWLFWWREPTHNWPVVH